MRKQVLAILFLALVNSAVAQTDTLFFQPAIDLAIGTSSSIKDAGEAIYNGREHLGYLPSIKGIAYYTSAEWQPGSIVYRNVSYKNVFLKYDLVKDEVIIRHVNGFTGVTLFTPRVESVIILNKHFVNLPGDGKLLSAGLYEKVNKGVIALYVRRSKFINETTTSRGVDREFIDKNSYYVFKDGVYHTIKKQADMTDLLKMKKSEINSLLKGSGLKFKNDPEAAIIKIVDHYNQSRN